MKVILLAGGLGTRISEETIDKPKPMVLLNDKPIIWHLMQIFAIQGISDFIIAGGYKVSIIEDWVSTLKSDWNIQVLDTGLDTQTGGRIKLCLEKYPNEKDKTKDYARQIKKARPRQDRDSMKTLQK